jgi:hypothetical protein
MRRGMTADEREFVNSIFSAIGQEAERHGLEFLSFQLRPETTVSEAAELIPVAMQVIIDHDCIDGDRKNDLLECMANSYAIMKEGAIQFDRERARVMNEMKRDWFRLAMVAIGVVQTAFLVLMYWRLTSLCGM